MSSGDTLLVFTPQCFEPPLGESASLDQYGERPVLRFDPAVAQSGHFSGVLPAGYGGGGLSLVLGWAAEALEALAWTAWGDAAGALGNWTIAGASGATTDQWQLYWNLSVESGVSLVRLYRAAAKQAADEVAAGSVDHAAGGTVALASVNGSGLTGSVVVAPLAQADADQANVLSANRVRWEASVERLADGLSPLNGNSPGPTAAAYSAPAETAGRLRYAEILFDPQAGIDDVEPGEAMRLQVRRAAADPGDTLAGAALLLFLHVRGR